jgi:hypothetical protein
MAVVMMIPAIVVIVIAVRAVMMVMVMMPPTVMVMVMVMVMVIRSSVPDRLACRQWVNNGPDNAETGLPKCPRERTFAVLVGMSQTRQKRSLTDSPFVARTGPAKPVRCYCV